MREEGTSPRVLVLTKRSLTAWNLEREKLGLRSIGHEIEEVVNLSTLAMNIF